MLTKRFHQNFWTRESGLESDHSIKKRIYLTQTDFRRFIRPAMTFGNKGLSIQTKKPNNCCRHSPLVATKASGSLHLANGANKKRERPSCGPFYIINFNIFNVSMNESRVQNSKSIDSGAHELSGAQHTNTTAL